MKGVPLKRTYSVHFELTPHEYNQLKRLGSARWPREHLVRDELCRRLLLVAVREADNVAGAMLRH